MHNFLWQTVPIFSICIIPNIYIYYTPKESTYFGLDVLKKLVLEVSKHFGYKINAKKIIKSKVLESGQR